MTITNRLGVGTYIVEYDNSPTLAQNIKIFIPIFTKYAKKVDKKLFIKREITNIKHNMVSGPIIIPAKRLEIKKYGLIVFKVYIIIGIIIIWAEIVTDAISIINFEIL